MCEAALIFQAIKNAAASMLFDEMHIKAQLQHSRASAFIMGLENLERELPPRLGQKRCASWFVAYVAGRGKQVLGYSFTLLDTQ